MTYQASKQASKQANKQASKQASKQARRQISLLTSYGGACQGLPQLSSILSGNYFAIIYATDNSQLTLHSSRETFKLLQNIPLEVTISNSMCDKSNNDFWVCFVVVTKLYAYSRYYSPRELTREAGLLFQYLLLLYSLEKPNHIIT